MAKAKAQAKPTPRSRGHRGSKDPFFGMKHPEKAASGLTIHEDALESFLELMVVIQDPVCLEALNTAIHR